MKQIMNILLNLKLGKSGLGGDKGFNESDFFYFSCIYKNNIGRELLFERPDPLKHLFFIYITLKENGIIIQKGEWNKIDEKDLKELKIRR